MRRATPLSILTVAALLAGCSSTPAGRPAATSHSASPSATASDTPAATAVSGVPQLDHVVWVLLENRSYNAVIGSSSAPYINGLVNQGALATNYFALGHPSLPNYAGLTSGQSFPNAFSDCSPSVFCQSDALNIADRLEAAGLTWREYAESMPGPCGRRNSGSYLVRHNPWVYYTDITGARCTSHVLTYSSLANDFGSTNTTPSFSFVTPNACNNGHDCSTATADNWLSQNLPTILGSPAFTQQRSVLVVTYDEGSGSNHIPTILAGPSVRAGSSTSATYTHYSLLHTLELAFGLQPLTENDAGAPPITGIWN